MKITTILSIAFSYQLQKKIREKKEAWAWPKHVTSSSRSLSAEARMTLSERHVMRLPWTGKSSWRPALASTWQVHSCEPARSVRGIWQSYTLGRLLSEGAERIIMGFSEHIDTILNWTELYLRRPSAASLICCSRSTRYCSFCRRLALSDAWAPGTVMHLFLNTLLSSRTVQPAIALHNKSANESVSKQ